MRWLYIHSQYLSIAGDLSFCQLQVSARNACASNVYDVTLAAICPNHDSLAGIEMVAGIVARATAVWVTLARLCGVQAGRARWDQSGRVLLCTSKYFRGSDDGLS
jgi:hypothetical protein